MSNLLCQVIGTVCSLGVRTKTGLEWTAVWASFPKHHLPLKSLKNRPRDPQRDSMCIPILTVESLKQTYCLKTLLMQLLG